MKIIMTNDRVDFIIENLDELNILASSVDDEEESEDDDEEEDEEFEDDTE